MSLNERWAALQPRERWMVSVAAVALVLAVFYLGLWEPLAQSNKRLGDEVKQTRELVQWLQQIAPQAQRLRGSSRPPGQGSLLNLVDQSSKAAGLGQVISRLQPQGEHEVRLWLEKAPYQVLMRWLLGLEKDQGVSISELSISRGDASGLVSARVILKRGP